MARTRVQRARDLDWRTRKNITSISDSLSRWQAGSGPSSRAAAAFAEMAIFKAVRRAPLTRAGAKGSG
ncbi:MAG: hypothetical protein OER43_16855, partial [Gammaproteobacteria bacterium]|nr:hypothetical protein [Gammaproteobacteria bacterium]